MQIYREFIGDTLINKVFSIIILSISFITPLIGIVIAYIQNKNGKMLFKHSAILGICVAMTLFVVEFIIFAIQTGAAI